MVSRAWDRRKDSSRGADWQLLRADGYFVLDADYFMAADDGTQIHVRNRGLWHSANDGLAGRLRLDHAGVRGPDRKTRLAEQARVFLHRGAGARLIARRAATRVLDADRLTCNGLTRPEILRNVQRRASFFFCRCGCCLLAARSRRLNASLGEQEPLKLTNPKIARASPCFVQVPAPALSDRKRSLIVAGSETLSFAERGLL